MATPIFAQARRRLADIILGKQTVLFTSRKNIELMEAGKYLELPDHALAAATRRWFHAIEAAHVVAAAGQNRPVTTMIAQHAVLALATYASKVNAETASFIMRGSIDGGQTERVFSVEFTRLPDDYQMGPLGVAKEYDPNDPDKLTKLTLCYDTPGYDAWKAERAHAVAAEMVASPQPPEQSR